MWLLVRRLRRMTSVAGRWAEGDLSARIGDASRDELGVLSARFDHMANELERVMDMRRALAVNVERTRVARDLHDTAKQRSFVLGLKLTELAHEAKRHASPALAEIVASARNISAQLQQDLEQVVQGFHTPVAMQSGLRPAVVASLSELLSGQGVEWQLQLPADLCKALEHKPEISRELLLITQEAAANALRHSGCRQIIVRCERARDAGIQIIWSIHDDGHGMDLSTVRKGMGLDNLRWRASQLPTGSLTIESGPQGTQVSVQFVLPENA